MEIENKNNVAPIIGKTYSLYGGESSSDNFYSQLSLITDEVLRISGKTLTELLGFVAFISASKLRIRRSEKKDQFVLSLMELLRRNLSGYLTDVEGHLKTISLKTRFRDKSLATSYEQYLLYMLEIELTNRLYLQHFSGSRVRLAFLPHCLRDFSKDCMSLPDEVDHLCRSCSKKCTINNISKLLKKNEVTPYIWLQADLKKIFSVYKKLNMEIGVLGIACIPELVHGMRLCRKHNVPVVGIPLDANRCRRWMGEFYNNSININLLQSISQKS